MTVDDSDKSDHASTFHNPHSEWDYEVPRDRIIQSTFYSLVLLHFPRVPHPLSGEVTFET